MKKTKLEVMEHVMSFHGIGGDSAKSIYDAYNAVKPAHIAYGAPWCAMFLWFALQDQMDWFPCEASCDMMRRRFQQAGRWYEPGERKPLPGDVIFFSKKHTASDCTHVGYIMQCDYYNEILTDYEGNTSNMVAPRMYTFTDGGYIVGFGDLQDQYLT